MRMDTNPVENILYVADSYKITHHSQYPKGTSHVYSYFESRGGKFPEVCFFGLQYLLKRWLVGPVVNKQMIQQAKHFYKVHFGDLDVFNEAGWNHIVDVSITSFYFSSREQALKVCCDEVLLSMHCTAIRSLICLHCTTIQSIPWRYVIKMSQQQTSLV
uniref:Nicotinamide phosphoribosyltransferase N-terminal domain-containing protein n=1 Tax=Parascaris univalens TaxID=6257 RepID=A0A915A6K9_PARUN